MAFEFRKLMFAVVMPGLLLTLTYILVPKIAEFPLPLIVILPYLPYVFFIIGMSLSWAFNNSREFNILTVLVLIYWGLHQFYWQVSTNQTEAVFAALCVLLPFNFMLNSKLKERGILTLYGMKHLGIIVLQAALIAWLLTTPATLLHQGLLLAPIDHVLLAQTPITQAGLVLLIICLLYLCMLLVDKPDALHGGLLGAFLVSTAALHLVTNELTSTFLFTMTGITIVMALIFNAYHLAYMDELTNLPSRRALEQHLLTLGSHYTVVMVDVDNFKDLNDTYGHDVGDQILHMLAARLRGVSGGGKTYRYGGEEFTIVFSGRDSLEAKVCVDGLRAEIAATPFVIRGKERPSEKPMRPKQEKNTKEIRITISAGISEKAKHHYSAQNVVKSADKALYRAKESGRNCVSF